jgi:prefoldin subunit 5
MLRQESAVEQLAFHRAKRAVEEAEDKLRLLKKWAREFESRVQPLAKQIEKLQTVFSNDMVQALAYLAQTVQALAAYAEIQAPAAEVPSVKSEVRDSEPKIQNQSG